MSATTAPTRRAPAQSTILVTGDVVIDHHVYEGERRDPGDKSKRGVHQVTEPGGMWCLHRLLAALFQNYAASLAAERQRARHEFEIAKLTAKYRRTTGEQVDDPKERGVAEAIEERWEVRAGIAPTALTPASPDNSAAALSASGPTSYAVWQPTAMDHRTDTKRAKPADIVWRTDATLGYGGDEAASEPVSLTDDISPQILVLDDANLTFRLKRSAKAWHLRRRSKDNPAFIVLKTNAPVARGPLWEYLCESSGAGSPWLDRTVVVISADALRNDNVGINHGLSWERTIEDVRETLFTSPTLKALTRARHLVISFATEGALWLSRRGSARAPQWHATLVFDAARAEGEWRESMDGHAFGYLTCLTASIVRGLAHHVSTGASSNCDLELAIQAGLSAMRDLHRRGHGTMADAELPSGFPVARLAEAIRGGGSAFQSSPVPWLPPQAVNDRGAWSIVEMSQGPLLTSNATRGLTGLGRQVVMRGLRAIESLPHARFGKFVTADRREIETLRHVRHLMWKYRHDKSATKPLSIGVFGPPGAGKSFAVRQLAEAIFGDKAWMEFNLSQFAGPNDFIGALHQVRDVVLKGLIPVAFWDEFDAQEFEWLQYLLAPMQDGQFQEGQITHRVGKTVFIFAGGTSRTYDAFGARRRDGNAQRRFELRKGPDFHSRLDAHYDVLGPNWRTVIPAGRRPSDRDRHDETDIAAPLRRAIFISAHLPPPQDGPLDIDPGLVTALLEVPQYIHGARSLEKVLSSLRPASTGAPIRRSSLPAPDVLSMHVSPVDRFAQLTRYEDEVLAPLDIDIIAAAIQDNYLQTVNHAPPDPAFAAAFANLSESDKDANRAAARRIPDILALAGLKIARGRPTAAERERVDQHLAHHRELLAEAEHIGWMTERRSAGWRYGARRDNKTRVHNLLVPYGDLPKKEQDKDRDAVRNYPDVLDRAGYRIVFPGDRAVRSNPRRRKRRRTA